MGAGGVGQMMCAREGDAHMEREGESADDVWGGLAHGGDEVMTGGGTTMG